MIENNKKQDFEGTEDEARIEEARNYLCGYQLCIDMLQLRSYERKRARKFGESFDCPDILSGSELYWRARMHEIQKLIDKMRNGRDKLMLYYHYVQGESIEHSANLIGVSRRTGYRIHKRALRVFSYLYERERTSDLYPTGS